MLKRTLCVFFALLIAVLSFSACSSSGGASSEKALSEQGSTVKTDIYRFEDYADSEVFEIEKAELNGGLSEKCTTYKFCFDSDSNKIKAFISIPSSAAVSGEPCKCVLFCRGGNSNLGQLKESDTATISAACGRIVVSAEYRGTKGADGADQFGGAELDDVIKLIDLCQNKFSFVDMDDFCAAGVSRGGMMTYMAARKDDRIRRIAAVSALSDFENAYDERDDMKSVILEHIGVTPQSAPEEYEKRSAVCWADEIKVPVLIIHSRLDKQVPFHQAEEMYGKLKDHVDCKFIIYDDDLHGPRQEDFPIINEWLNNE